LPRPNASDDRPAPAAAPPLPARQALLLGLLHGPTELLPISSSAHTSLVAWLAGWRYDELDAELRKGFEVALHAGTAAALLIALRDDVAAELRGLDRRRLGVLVAASTPPAICGYLLERPIERRLSRPPAIVFGLVAGSLAMTLADILGSCRRSRDDAGSLDGLLIGIAQACALLPGVSRGGATLAAARALGFEHDAANELSRHCALPVIGGAAVFKGWRLWRRRGGVGAALPVGASAAFLSTLASSAAIARIERGRSLLPYAAYRVALAAVVIRRLRQNQSR
jgi:undecaprenyl-diphosphatase